MRGLALEGGGARGAYQIGVVKALVENGYVFDGVVGTSIGAINAAILAQGDVEKAVELWTNISVEKIFDEDEQPLIRLADVKSLKNELSLIGSLAAQKALLKVIQNRGVDTEKMKNLLERYIDEEKIREAGRDFGSVTISISDLKPLELMLEDIPGGQLFHYIMASASFPGFHPESIEGKIFLDGAFYNNCPFKLLLEKGYDEVIAVRTDAHGVFPKVKDPRVKLIVPQDDLGSIMRFDPDNCAEKMEIGYRDGLRFIESGNESEKVKVKVNKKIKNKFKLERIKKWKRL